MGREYDKKAWRDLRKLYNNGTYACHWCGATGVPLAVDHLVEVDRGGTRIDGTVPACRACNSRRGQAYTAEKRRKKYSNPKFH